MDAILSCARRWELARLRGLAEPEMPCWWLVGGHSVHLLSQRYEERLLLA
jgi:hypothetical protein